MKLEIFAPIIFAVVVLLLNQVSATLGIIGALLSIYYTSLKIHEHFKSKKSKSIFKSKFNP